MKDLVLVGLIAAAGAQGKEVFRYEDEDTGAVHYMNSLPEGAVEGGWQFKAGPEGEEDLYQLTYKAAKETGFVPEANYLPAAPVDTGDVLEARKNFMAFFKGEPVEGYMPTAPLDTDDVLNAKQKFMAFYNGEEVEGYMPVAPADTAEVAKAKELFFTSYQLEQEKQEKIQLEMKAEEKKMGDETEVVSERKKRAPEELDDQIAVESQAVDSNQEHPMESKVSEKLAHYTHPYINGVKRMPFKYHPYFNFYRQHMKEAEGEEANEGGANNASPLHSYHPYFYRPYYHYNPYFYYGPPQQPGMIEDDEAKKEDEPMYPKTDFYPFYMARPSEEELKEHQEKLAEYEEKLKEEIEAYEKKRKEIMDEYAEKMKAAAEELELPQHPGLIPHSIIEEEIGEEKAEAVGKGKTISLPVMYSSYFPRWRYTHFKNPVGDEEPMEKPDTPDAEEAVKEMKKRETTETYLPTPVQVTKTVVKPLGEEQTPVGPVSEPVAVAAAPISQPGIIYYPQAVPIVTRVHYPVFQYPVYPQALYQPLLYNGQTGVDASLPAGDVQEAVKKLVYSAETQESEASDQTEESAEASALVPASTTLIKAGNLPAAPLPESVFPIFPKVAEGEVEKQAALAL